MAAVETVGDVTSLAVKLRELEARRATIDTELRQLHPVPRLGPAVIEGRLAEWRRLLRQSATQGRAVLQRVLDERDDGGIDVTTRRGALTDAGTGGTLGTSSVSRKGSAEGGWLDGDKERHSEKPSLE